MTLDECKTLTKISTRTTSHKHSPKTSASFGHEGTRIPANKARSILHKNKKKQLADERPFAEEKAVCIIIIRKRLFAPLFIDTTLDKTHYRLKDVTGLLLDGTYHVNHIKKGSACSPLGIVDKFDTYETALKNTLLNKFGIKTSNNKLQEVTLQDGSKELNYLPGTIMDYASLQS